MHTALSIFFRRTSSPPAPLLNIRGVACQRFYERERKSSRSTWCYDRSRDQSRGTACPSHAVTTERLTWRVPGNWTTERSRIGLRSPGRDQTVSLKARSEKGRAATFSCTSVVRAAERSFEDYRDYRYRDDISATLTPTRRNRYVVCARARARTYRIRVHICVVYTVVEVVRTTGSSGACDPI